MLSAVKLSIAMLSVLASLYCLLLVKLYINSHRPLQLPITVYTQPLLKLATTGTDYRPTISKIVPLRTEIVKSLKVLAYSR